MDHWSGKQKATQETTVSMPTHKTSVIISNSATAISICCKNPVTSG
jgi:hypothetical protein